MKYAVILSVAMALPLSALAQDETKAMVITQGSKPAECISPVAIRKIDGRNKFVSPQGFEVDAGLHTMSGSVALNTSNCPVVRPGSSSSIKIPPLEAEFEAGKTYYVGFDHSSNNRTEWGLVVWKVED